MSAHSCDIHLMTTDAPAFRAILAEADRIGWPVAFRTDLDHDADFIARQAPPAFVWIISPCGTHIIAATDATTGPLQVRGTEPLYSSRELDCIARAFEPEKRFFTWDGLRLAEVTLAQAREFLRGQA
jgi:hypothetical protein